MRITAVNEDTILRILIEDIMLCYSRQANHKECIMEGRKSRFNYSILYSLCSSSRLGHLYYVLRLY